MNISQTDLTRWHALYCALTDRELPCTMAMNFTWENFISHGWTEADLALVVKHIKSLIKLKRRRPESLRFHLLIGDTERFNEDISEARALARVPKPNYRRQEVLKATGRTEEPKSGFLTSEEVLASDAFKALLNIRDGGSG